MRSFMAHHQGMSLLALAYVLLDRPMQRRFEADPLFQATDAAAAGARAASARRSTRTPAELADVRAAAGRGRGADARLHRRPTRRRPRCSCCPTAATT